MPCLELDVTDEAHWKDVVAAVTRDYGSVDILVNNAGVAAQSPIDRLTLEQWNRIVSVNLTGTFLGCRAVTPAMKKHGRGSIINVSSVDGARGRNGLHAYTASKYGIRGLTQSLAVELGPAGIRVNTVLPGLVPTPMTARVDPDSFAIPPQRSGTVEEIGAVVQFLASDAASYVSGAEIAIDGGLISGIPRHR